MKRLKRLRESRKLTQEKLGEMLNVQKAAVSKYETGLVVPSPEVLKKLSAIFGVSIDYLMENDIATSDPPPPPPLNDEENNLLNSFRRLSSDSKHALLTVVRQMAPARRAAAQPSMF